MAYQYMLQYRWTSKTCATTTESMHSRAHALQLERSPHATVKIPYAETKTQHSQK